jgi:predicted cation transporter
LFVQITEDTEVSLAAEEEEEKLGKVFVRAGKVYIFVMALIFLDAGFKPLIDTYLLKLPSQILFWVNMVSATLAAAEIGVKVLTERVAPELEVMIRVYIERT